MYTLLVLVCFDLLYIFIELQVNLHFFSQDGSTTYCFDFAIHHGSLYSPLNSLYYVIVQKTMSPRKSEEDVMIQYRKS